MLRFFLFSPESAPDFSLPVKFPWRFYEHPAGHKIAYNEWSHENDGHSFYNKIHLGRSGWRFSISFRASPFPRKRRKHIQTISGLTEKNAGRWYKRV